MPARPASRPPLSLLHGWLLSGRACRTPHWTNRPRGHHPTGSAGAVRRAQLGRSGEASERSWWPYRPGGVKGGDAGRTASRLPPVVGLARVWGWRSATTREFATHRSPVSVLFTLLSVGLRFELCRRTETATQRLSGSGYCRREPRALVPPHLLSRCAVSLAIPPVLAHPLLATFLAVPLSPPSFFSSPPTRSLSIDAKRPWSANGRWRPPADCHRAWPGPSTTPADGWRPLARAGRPCLAALPQAT